MKVRQTKKIWGMPFDKFSDYWWTRILRYIDGSCIDHRIAKASRIIGRIKKSMKQDEIKNGDWVLYHSAPIKVAETELELFSAWDMEDHFLGKIPYEDAAPIPLTKEILEGNGWQLYKQRTIKFSGMNGMEFYNYMNANSSLEIRTYSRSVGYRFKAYWSDAFLGTLYSVHELQHLLWALGKDSNLKIV